MVTIETIVPAKSKVTTLTVREATRRRLADYKRGDSSFDDVLNTLMDAVPLENFMEEELAEHLRRLKDFRPIAVDELKRRLGASRTRVNVRRPA